MLTKSRPLFAHYALPLSSNQLTAKTLRKASLSIMKKIWKSKFHRLTGPTAFTAQLRYFKHTSYLDKPPELDVFKIEDGIIGAHFAVVNAGTGVLTMDEATEPRYGMFPKIEVVRNQKSNMKKEGRKENRIYEGSEQAKIYISPINIGRLITYLTLLWVLL